MIFRRSSASQLVVRAFQQVRMVLLKFVFFYRKRILKHLPCIWGPGPGGAPEIQKSITYREYLSNEYGHREKKMTRCLELWIWTEKNSRGSCMVPVAASHSKLSGSPLATRHLSIVFPMLIHLQSVSKAQSYGKSWWLFGSGGRSLVVTKRPRAT